MKVLRNCFVLSIVALALVSLTFADDEEYADEEEEEDDGLGIYGKELEKFTLRVLNVFVEKLYLW